MTPEREQKQKYESPGLEVVEFSTTNTIAASHDGVAYWEEL